MADLNIMKQALGEQWKLLPVALKAHYQDEGNIDIGSLDVEYPGWMQMFLNMLHIVGALLNRRGVNIPTAVVKTMRGGVQFWNRKLLFDDGGEVLFKSHWCYVGSNKLIEYVNPVIGLCMSVEVIDKKIYYHGKYFVIKIGNVRVPIPEWLLLGHTTIVEEGIDDMHFAMDFRLQHPLFGQIYRYAGKFRTEKI